MAGFVYRCYSAGGRLLYWAGSQSTGQLRASSQNTIGEKPVILFRPVKITKKRGWRRRAR